MAQVEDFTTPPLYSLKNIRKTYISREGPVVDIPDLSIPRGQVISLIGFSGSGKTTLLNILAMLETPDPASQDSLQSLSFVPQPGAPPEDMLRLSDERRQELRSGFGFVFQQGYLLENLSCAANIKIPFQISRLDADSSDTGKMMRSVGLDEGMSNRQPSDLSGGERQRVSVLRALGHSPSVVFADEPTSNLDEVNANAVLAGLRAWCKETPNRTVILVTHHIGHAVRYSDTVILMAAGKISGPIPVHPADGPPLTAVDVSTRLENKAVVPQADSEHPFVSAPAPRPEAHPRSARRKFILAFALSDVFPRVSSATSGSFLKRIFTKGILRTLIGRRNAQFHSMASMFFAMVLALFFASLYSALSGRIIDLVNQDRRIARIEVLGHRDGERLLSQKDIDELSGLSWVLSGGGMRIASPNEIHSGGLRPLAKAVESAVGYRVREMRFARNPQRSNLGFSGETTLNAVSTRVSDPILKKIEIMEGNRISELSPGHRTVESVLRASAAARSGVICTRAALSQLGFDGDLPKTLDVFPEYSSAGQTPLPLIGVVESLPKSTDILITEEMYRTFFFAGGSGDPLPRYESVDVYFEDMMKDGIGLYDALDRLGYSFSSDGVRLLRWVESLVRAIRYFSLAAGAGIFLVVLVTLVVSYTEAIRRKEKQIGVLLAYGAPMSLLYAVFLVEVSIVWFVAAALAVPCQWLVAGAVEGLVKKGFETQAASTVPPPVPWDLWVMILAVSLVVAIVSVAWTMRRTIDPTHVAQTLRTPD